MRLYHATGKCDLEYIDDIYSKSDNDFGKGVYVTSIKEQAEDWAKKKSKDRDNYKGIGAVYEGEVDLDDLSILEYSEDDEDFNYLCYLCRYEAEKVAKETINNFEKADIIYGPMLAKPEKYKECIKCFHCGDEEYRDEDFAFLPNKDKVKSIKYDVKCDIITFKDLEDRMKLHDTSRRNQFCLKSKKVIELFNKGIKKVTYIKRNKKGFSYSEQFLEYDEKQNKIIYLK